MIYNKQKNNKQKRHHLILCITILFISIICIITTSCKSNKIDVPTNIITNEENILSWDSVDLAKSYNVRFYYIDQDSTYESNTRKTNYSLDQLEVGDYEIRVQSISGVKDKKDSEFSEIIYFHKYLETGCQYSLINNNTEYQITKVGKAKGTFTIEDYYRGKAVTKIADNAFKGNTKVIDITMGENVMTIGNQAFYNCAKLERMILPNNIVSIGNACFQSCRSLKEIIIPNVITTIPEFCFAYCRGLVNVTLGNNISTISTSSFQDCSSLQSIDIPDSVVTIGESAFSGCSNLTSVTIGKNVSELTDFVFLKCPLLKVVKFNEGSKVKYTGNQTFAECISLEEITLPNGLEEVGYGSFYKCEALNQVTIPATCKKVGAYAFTLTKLYTDQIDQKEDFVYADNWLVGCSNEVKENLEVINTETLKDTIVGIADQVFASSQSLKTVIFPASFKYIGSKAFYGCTNLWKLWTLTDSIEEIGDSAFEQCGITNLILGDGLKRIGNYAFYGNPQLDNNATNPQYLIPETVTSVGTLAYGNTKLWNSASNVVKAANWVIGFKEDRLNSLTLEFDTSKIAGIADYAFYNSESLRTIQGLNNCRYIGKGAFYGCVNLTSISLNRNLTEIKPFTFYGCSNLIKATLPRTLTSIGNYAFYKCNLLTEVNLESTSCETIGKSAFYQNTSLATLSLSKSLKSIDDYAFYKCISLTNIEFPEKLASLGIKAFYKCDNLDKIKFNDNLEVIPESAFNSCGRLKEITLGKNTKEINKSAFYKCESVTVLNLNENLEKIGDYAFYGLKEITTLKLPTTLTTIGNYAFKGLNNIQTLIIKNTIQEIGQHAFYGCNNMTIYTNTKTLPGLWHKRFNSSYRPIFYDTNFTEDDNISSINYTKDLVKNISVDSIINLPNGKSVSYWVDENNTQYEKINNLDYEGLLIPKWE